MKTMRAKYNGKCAATGVRIVVGDAIIYFGKAKGCWSVAAVQEAVREMPRLIIDMLDAMICGDCEWFTLEESKGETYHNTGEWNLYGHGIYERGSCLAGQPKRVFMDTIGNENDAAELEKAAPKWIELTKYGAGSSTHIPVDLMVSHLPDTPDTGW
tara:strand:+ start:2805 stop:3272 length:468 start_codon:yes stop_codon:yes gene_type:complete